MYGQVAPLLNDKVGIVWTNLPLSGVLPLRVGGVSERGTRT
jgi:hypothetical protein